MPGMNRLGPRGNGPMTGRGLGQCRSFNVTEGNYRQNFGHGLGLGCGGRRFETNYNTAPITEQEKKDYLTNQKEFLENELININNKLKEI